MILVTVGTEKFPFDRLMQWIDNLIEQNLLDLQQEEIVIQYGSCNILPKGANNYALLPQDKFQDFVARSRLIIAHCGEGTIDLLASNPNKSFVLVPRSDRFQEHVDDHQIELADKLVQLGIPIAKSLEDLVDFIADPIAVEIKKSPSNYYAEASLLLEAQFNTPEVLEASNSNLIGNFIPLFA